MATVKKATAKSVKSTSVKKNTTAVDTEAAVAVSATKTDLAVSDSVIVALNHPNGIIFDLDGNRRIKINGNAEGLRGKDKGHIPVGAFGLTTIKREEWEEIQKRYGSMKLFTAGLIFTSESKRDAEAEAEEKQDTRHGREPVDPKTDSQLKGRITETSAPAE